MSAGITLALPVDMAGFKNLLQSVSPNISICVRGRHAVGKSEGVYQVAAELRSDVYKDAKFCQDMVVAYGGKVKHVNGYKTSWSYEDGIPVMERRLSQMTEGDTIGLPFDSANGTMFKACDWLILCCKYPSLLFLDERNRALEGVKQSVFQLCDSKAFYGNKLHDETRVVIAENVGDEYQVQACDPAEISRCAIIVLEPSVRDWLNYAENKCHQATIEFIRQNESKLEHTGTFEPNKKYPDRRSWFKLDQELQRLDLFDNPENPIFRVLAGSMLGAEVGPAFYSFCKERERQVSAKDIIKDWTSAKKRLSKGAKGHVTNEQYVECVHKLADLLKKYKISDPEAKQISDFMHDCPAEVLMTAWSAFQKNVENLFKIHSYVAPLMLKTARLESVEKKEDSKETAENSTSNKRGARK